MPEGLPAKDALDFRDREALFRRAEERTFDLIVIGGGITGAGIARSASARGLRVALVEACDLASGTSSRSSKMIHGGVRYLAQGDISLVREAASERQILRRIAPHLARVTPFLLPTQSTAGLARFRAAMWSFEKLGGVAREERHEVWSASEVAEREPVAALEGCNGAVLYYEFLTDDARLTVANARSAAGDGALVLTYAPVREFLREGERVVGVRCESTLPGEQREMVLRGRCLVNAAGPWVDALRELEDAGEGPRLALTKGIHLAVPHARLPLERTVLMSAADRRPVFAVPCAEITYLGTTDTFHPGAEYWPDVREEEVDYLFEAAGRSFACPALRPEHVTACWSGVRPLIAQSSRKKPSEISRKDEVWRGPGGVLSIAGGKLTSYRAMAERVVDRLAKELGASKATGDTHERPLAGGDFDPSGSDDPTQEGERGRARLLDLYGSERGDVEAQGADVAAEARQAVCREGALRLEDYWQRRSGRSNFDLDAGLASLEPASREMGALLGWSEEFREGEVAGCRALHRDQNRLFREARSAAEAEGGME